MNHVVILAGGTGSRFGGNIPKQYIEVKGRPIISWCLDVLFSNEDVDTVRVVADISWQSYINDYIELHEKKYIAKWKGFCLPGENRQLSIWNALEAMRGTANNDLVMFHDAARPNIKDDFISKCFNSVESHDGVMPIIPVKDTIYLCDENGKVDKLLPRSKLFAGQAPEVFKYGSYYKANQKLIPEKIKEINGSTEPAIIAGLDIATIEGDENNFKITTAVDMDKFKAHCTG